MCLIFATCHMVKIKRVNISYVKKIYAKNFPIYSMCLLVTNSNCQSPVYPSAGVCTHNMVSIFPLTCIFFPTLVAFDLTQSGHPSPSVDALKHAPHPPIPRFSALPEFTSTTPGPPPPSENVHCEIMFTMYCPDFKLNLILFLE